MGGNLAWTLRYPDGTELRMDRWTNIMSWAIPNAKFFDADPEHLEAVVSSWKQMADDWNQNKDTGVFENNMTNVYAPYPFGMVPSEYGLIVTDFVTKTILSSQGYTSFDKIHFMRHDLEDPEGLEQFRGLINTGRILSAETWNSDDLAFETIIDFTEYAVLDIEPKIRELFSGKVFGVNFTIDPKPFTIEEFPESNKGLIALRDRALELGFVLDEAETKEWASIERKIKPRKKSS